MFFPNVTASLPIKSLVNNISVKFFSHILCLHIQIPCIDHFLQRKCSLLYHFQTPPRQSARPPKLVRRQGFIHFFSRGFPLFRAFISGVSKRTQTKVHKLPLQIMDGIFRVFPQNKGSTFSVSGSFPIEPKILFLISPRCRAQVNFFYFFNFT